MKLPCYTHVFPVLLLLFLLLPEWGCQSSPTSPGDNSQEIQQQMERVLTDLMFDKWYPACIDTMHGGYLSDFAFDWKPDGSQNKMIVTQSRNIWSLSKGAEFFPDKKSSYQEMAAHGVDFLKNQMWDTENGGFFWMTDQAGKPIDENSPVSKSAYGNSFAIYGLAAYNYLSGDPEALEMAKKTFYWLEEHSHDKVNGGYYAYMDRAGTVFSHENFPDFSPDLLRNTYKDQNPTIHLLEAFAELYTVWPDSLLKERLVELLRIVRDTITDQHGHMQLYFLADWSPVSYRDSALEVREQHYGIDHISSGHDVETAFLMLEASEVLGHFEYDKTLVVAKKMVDHSFAHVYDHETGGFYEQGYYVGNTDSIIIVDERKNWWAQAEGVHSLLLFSTLFPEEKTYQDGFMHLWAYIQKYLIDQTHGGWYSFGIDNEPEYQEARKGHIWKGSYHTARALMSCSRLLKQ